MAGQLFTVNSLGGFYASFNLSKELREGVQATSKFRQFADIKDAWGKVTRTGQTFTWDTVPMLTRASRALLETNTIGQGSHTILQGTLKMNVRAIVDGMKGRNIPYYSEGDAYYCISRPAGLRVLKNDLESVHQYTETALAMIKKGEIGRYEDCKFFEQTTIPTGG